MLNQKTTLSKVRNSFVITISCQFLPMLVVGWSKNWLEQLPQYIGATASLLATMLFAWGYVYCFKLTFQYAKYKGYPNLFGLLGLFNVFGAAIIFFLPDKNITSHLAKPDQPAIINFSISAIFLGYLAVQILLIPVIALGVILFGNGGTEQQVDQLLQNEDFIAIILVPLGIILSAYFFWQLKQAQVNFKQLTGSFKQIDFKLPLGLAVLNYFFADGSSTMILYGLSFIVPGYVENQINQVYANTPLGYSFLAFSVLIFAPIMEELFFRGIILQKLAIKQNTVRGLIFSALLFTVVHFRSDVISLFAAGIILALLYLKTKQIIVPIICHFVYNLLFTLNSIYWKFFGNSDYKDSMSIEQFHQYFSDHLELNILYVALSAPYLIYFIYKNFPRNYKITKLPYFANQD